MMELGVRYGAVPGRVDLNVLTCAKTVFLQIKLAKYLLGYHLVVGEKRTIDE